MIRIRHGALAVAVLAALALLAGPSSAAVEVHRLNLVLSAMPSEIRATGFNDLIDRYNAVVLRPRGYEDVDKIRFGWLFDGELRYFVRPNFAVGIGASQLRARTKREFLPALSQGVVVDGIVNSVPIHVGGAYYPTSFKQGDFEARTFLGGGVISSAYTRSTIEQVLVNPDTTLQQQFGRTFRQESTQDATGYYVEGGVHMFFALRYSVVMNVFYRDLKLRGMLDEATGQPFLIPPTNRRYDLDLGGLGARFGIAIGL